MPPPPKNPGPMTWDDFTDRLKAIYWPGIAPAARQLSRPLPEGETDQVVPDDIWQAAIVIFPDPEGWLANPVPQLKSKTPLEALAKGQAQEVRSIVMGVADFFLPDPDEVVPWDEFEQAVADQDAREAAEAAEAAAKAAEGKAAEGKAAEGDTDKQEDEAG